MPTSNTRSSGASPVASTVSALLCGSMPTDTELSAMPRATITLRGCGVIGSRFGMRCLA